MTLHVSLACPTEDVSRQNADLSAMPCLDAHKASNAKQLDVVFQEGSLSVWKRQPGQLNYSIISINKLVPPPSRISNNATVNVLCLAASLWLRCNTDPSRSTLVSPLHHSTTSFAPLPSARPGNQQSSGNGAATHSPARGPDSDTHSGAAGTEADPSRETGGASASQPLDIAAAQEASDAVADLSIKTESASSASAAQSSSSLTTADATFTQKQDRESLLVMTVSDDGHVWQWDVPLHGFLPPPKIAPGTSPAAPAKNPALGLSTAASPKPALLGLLHTLPHSVTTFSVCPVPVGAGWAGDLNQPSSQSGEGGDAVAVLAAVTSAGNVELITVQRGSLTPLSSAISVSLGMLFSPWALHEKKETEKTTQMSGGTYGGNV